MPILAPRVIADDGSELTQDAKFFYVDNVPVQGVSQDNFPYPKTLYRAHREAEAQGILNVSAPKGSPHRFAYEAVKDAQENGTIPREDASSTRAGARPTVSTVRAGAASIPGAPRITPGATMTPTARGPGLSNYTTGYVATASGTDASLEVKPGAAVTIRDIRFSGTDTAAKVKEIKIGNVTVWTTSTSSTPGQGYPISDLSGSNTRNNLLDGFVISPDQPLRITVTGASTANVVVLVEHSSLTPGACGN